MLGTEKLLFVRFIFVEAYDMVLDITQYINETIVCYFLVIFKILFRWGTTNWLLNTWLFFNRLVFWPCFYTNFSKRVIATCFTNLSCWSSSLAWFLQKIIDSSLLLFSLKRVFMIKSFDLVLDLMLPYKAITLTKLHRVNLTTLESRTYWDVYVELCHSPK